VFTKVQSPRGNGEGTAKHNRAEKKIGVGLEWPRCFQGQEADKQDSEQGPRKKNLPADIDVTIQSERQCVDEKSEVRERVPR